MKPPTSALVVLNSTIPNFIIEAGEKFETIQNEDGSIRLDYAKRCIGKHGFPVRGNNAPEFVEKANRKAQELLDDLIVYYAPLPLPENWRIFKQKEGLGLSLAFKLYGILASKQ